MNHGQESGRRYESGEKRGDEGFVSPTFAIALLLVITLVFSAAHIQWAGSSAAGIQEVADSAALAGANMVASYRTVVLVVDSVVLSLGLMGVTMLALALLLACVPATHPASVEISQMGRSVLDARRRFAESATPILQQLEVSLPILVAARASAIVDANADGHSHYVGTALALPFTPATQAGVFTDAAEEYVELESARDEVESISSELSELSSVIDAALEDAWLADCGSTPFSMYQRAQTLAGMDGRSNPYIPDMEAWDFQIGLDRARAYYDTRLDLEAPEGTGDIELSKSVSRAAFYRFASNQLADATVMNKDGEGVCTIPYLPRNTEEVRGTSLYTDAVYPVILLDGALTLHASEACSSAAGDVVAFGSVSGIESTEFVECPTCSFTVKTLGATPSASTNIDNGFEYHLRAFSEAAYAFETAKTEYDRIEQDAEGAAGQGIDAFTRALEVLSVPRVGLAPPGRAGCIAVVAVGERTSAQALDNTFFPGIEIDRGVAIAGAALAKTDGSQDSTVLTDFVDHARSEQEGSSFSSSAASTLMETWSTLLLGYQDGVGATKDALGEVLRLGGDENEFSRWVSRALDETLHATGFEPINLEVVKPALVNTKDIYDAAGMDMLSTTRRVLEELPARSEELDAAKVIASISGIAGELGYDTVMSLGEIVIPGTGISLPITIDITDLEEAA